MFHSSSQRKFWTFDSEDKVEQMRCDANQKFRNKMLESGKPGLSESMFLDRHEEDILFRYYEMRLLDFCNTFKPAMPKSVVGTAFMYFRRFYLNNSVMEHHPRIIMLTCAYLACKVDEFNVSCSQFVGNLMQETPEGQERVLEQILEYELLLIQQLNFHLVVHNPYRPMEGLLIDIKTRYPSLENPESLRKSADDFVAQAAMTDSGLLFSPSQIALTAILNSAARASLDIQSFLAECLGLKEDKDTLSKLYDSMRCMKNLLKKYGLPKPEEVNVCKLKLERIHAECVTSSNNKRKRGYVDDDYVAKEPRLTEEACHHSQDWSDEDLI
ncbi:cyclin-H [Thalassophryne amazonica]|uniref:cyclin-H n=1 Tax=Thalassophryne amazonica TaxID=390379 RepID=UPI0014718A20|nr:cyclin-H [Thalassophryne amazonica]XP_034025987.1 cyclin-H [Thalassophryne amazonica]XP_034025988.1 cyclin-H [Thalassophryne amazonica]XP_034025989.1 cyclin-H [Thalassophryne amazonica]